MKYEDGRPDRLLIAALLLLAMFLIFMPFAHAESITEANVREAIRVKALKYGIDPSLAEAIAKVESGYNLDAVGTRGEVGVFQLRPQYHAVVAGQVDQNIEVALAYLAKLRVQCAAYGDAYFVCYNTGPALRLRNPKQFSYYLKVKAAQAAQLSIAASN